MLGKAYEAIGNYELASDEFRSALMLDVYCHEAFDKVIGHHLLTSAEGNILSIYKIYYATARNHLLEHSLKLSRFEFNFFSFDKFP